MLSLIEFMAPYDFCRDILQSTIPATPVGKEF